MIYPADSAIHLPNNWPQAPVVQKVDSAIHRINQYPTHLVSLGLIQWIVIYPADSAIHLPNNWPQAPVVQKVDSAIHRINQYPTHSAIGFARTYPVDSDLSGG